MQLILAGLMLFYISSASALDKDLFASGKNLSKICATCHGEEGISSNGRVPHLAGQHEMYLLKQLKDFRERRRFNAAMRQVTISLNDQEMKALAHYYSNLPR
jgi:cytochrome c553